MNAIETKDLTKIYPSHLGRAAKPSLDSLNLHVDSNEVFGFLGKNGAGKTTTIKILCGLTYATRGNAYICGIDCRHRDARRQIGYLPENPYFYEYLSPRETIEFYGRLDGLTRKERRHTWERLCDLLDMTEIGDRRIRGFSKGMRQRIGFAAALVGDPKVLILDEPMSGLDPLGRRMIRELILRMRDEGKTVFFSSHVLSDVEQICNRVAIINEGQLVVEGRVDALLTRKITEVEIIANRITEEDVRRLNGSIVSCRESEDGYHLTVSTVEEANALTQAIHSLGGTILECNPIKQSLEDYFVRLQDERVATT